jgi:hypothetical protein
MIDSTSETLIALADVPAHLPNRRGGKRATVSCAYRWAQKGCQGVVLETLQCGGTKITSLEALQRFFERLSGAANSTSTATRTLRQRQRASEKANQELAADGW